MLTKGSLPTTPVKDFRFMSHHRSITIRPAATLIMLRNSPTLGIPEVFVQQRQATMSYAANMVVFPGGGVETNERLDPTMAYCPTTMTAAELTEPQLLTAAAAAIREVAEETQLQLPRHQPIHLVDRWITPNIPVFRRRYDVVTFATILADDQEPVHDTTEATASYWACPEELLQRWQWGQISLLPPTWFHLTQLAQRQADDALSSLRSVTDADTPKMFPSWAMDGQYAQEFYRLADVAGQHHST